MFPKYQELNVRFQYQFDLNQQESLQNNYFL